MPKDDDMVLIADYETICRLCLQSTGAMSDIYQTYEELPIKDLILSATGLEVSSDDGLPSKICHKCRYIVELCYELCTMVVRTHALLTEAAVSGNVAIDSVKKTVKEKECDSFPLGSKIQINQGSHLEPINQDDSHENNVEFVAIDTLDEDYVYYENDYLYDEDDENGKSDHGATGDNSDANKNMVDSNSGRNSELDKTEIHSNDLGTSDCEGENECQNSIDGDNGHKTYEEERKPPPLPLKRKRSRLDKPKRTSCNICVLRFPTVEELYEHVPTHYTDTDLTSYLRLRYPPFECEVCNDGAKLNKRQLLMHHRRHLNIDPLKCQYPGCKFIGKHVNATRIHQRIHQSRTHECKICNAKFRSAGNLREHLSVHDKKLPCRKCGKKLKRNSLRKHLVTHMPPKFTCGWRGCPKTFKLKYELMQHQHVHMKDRKYKCNLCNYASYYNKASLIKHIIRHNTSSNNSCALCDEKFEDYGDYYKHRVQKHGLGNLLRCFGCSRGYPYRDQDLLEKHMKLCAVVKNMRTFEARVLLERVVPTPKVVPTTKETTEVEKERRLSAIIEVQNEDSVVLNHNIIELQ